MVRWLVVIAAVTQSLGAAGTEESASRARYSAQVKTMFYHGWDSYLKYGFPADELAPLSCSGRDTWGSYVSDHPIPCLVA